MILGIFAHPRDEVKYFGGYIATQGGEKRMAFLTRGYKNKKPTGEWDSIIRRMTNLSAYELIYQYAHIPHGNDGELKHQNKSKIVNTIADLINEFKPDTIITTSPNDISSDHRVVGKCVLDALVKTGHNAKVMTGYNKGHMKQWKPNEYLQFDERLKKIVGNAYLCYELLPGDQIRNRPKGTEQYEVIRIG